MLMAERHQLILQILEKEGKLVARDLGLELNVSEDTIRRDLGKLSKSGMLQRVHGGALPSSPSAVRFSTRPQTSSIKTAMARAAIKMIQPGQVVILDGGTTTLQIAKEFPLDLKITVITNGPPIAVILAEHPNIEVIIAGGRLQKDSIVGTGAETINMLQKVRADYCFLGIYGIHPEEGITNPNLEEAYVKKMMIDRSAEVVGLASAEKLGTATTYTVGAINNLTHLITEKKVSSKILEPYKKQGITVVQV